MGWWGVDFNLHYLFDGRKTYEIRRLISLCPMRVLRKRQTHNGLHRETRDASVFSRQSNRSDWSAFRLEYLYIYILCPIRQFGCNTRIHSRTLRHFLISNSHKHCHIQHNGLTSRIESPTPWNANFRCISEICRCYEPNVGLPITTQNENSLE